MWNHHVGGYARVTVILLMGVLASVVGAGTSAATVRGDDGVACRLDHEHELHVSLDPGAEAEIHRTAAGTIRVNGHPCSAVGIDGSDTANVWNTKTVRIHGDAGGERATIKLANGGFSPGYGDENGNSDEIEFVVLMGQGWDQLVIHGTSGSDEIAFGSKPGMWVPTPAINLNATDGDLDLVYQSADFVIAWGYGGDDTLGSDPSMGTAFLPLRLTGGTGQDTLTGGSDDDTVWGDEGGDTLRGGPGNDKLYTKDSVEGNDEGYGGPGTDDCISDPEDLQSSC